MDTLTCDALVRQEGETVLHAVTDTHVRHCILRTAANAPHLRTPAHALRVSNRRSQQGRILMDPGMICAAVNGRAISLRRVAETSTQMDGTLCALQWNVAYGVEF